MIIFVILHVLLGSLRKYKQESVLNALMIAMSVIRKGYALNAMLLLILENCKIVVLGVLA